MKTVIGLTGTMLSGKSEALKIFKKCGAFGLSADDIVADLLKTDDVQQKLIKELGAADKPSLINCLKTTEHRKKLESVLHPLAKKEAYRLIEESVNDIVVFEVPLLFEVGMEKDFDVVMVISGSSDLALRLKKRGVGKEDFSVRRVAQLSDKEKTDRADIVVFNNGTLKDLETKIKKIYKLLKK